MNLVPGGLIGFDELKRGEAQHIAAHLPGSVRWAGGRPYLRAEAVALCLDRGSLEQTKERWQRVLAQDKPVPLAASAGSSAEDYSGAASSGVRLLSAAARPHPRSGVYERLQAYRRILHARLPHPRAEHIYRALTAHVETASPEAAVEWLAQDTAVEQFIAGVHP